VFLCSAFTMAETYSVVPGKRDEMLFFEEDRLDGLIRGAFLFLFLFGYFFFLFSFLCFRSRFLAFPSFASLSSLVVFTFDSLSFSFLFLLFFFLSFPLLSFPFVFLTFFSFHLYHTEKIGHSCNVS
jgi:hypothetical protein